MSLFSTFSIGKRGMSVAQMQLTTTSHNMANATTKGYSRQRVNVVASKPFSGDTHGQVGTGSEIRSIERVRDSFIDYQIRNENSTLGKASVRSDILYQVEGVFNEPSDTSISSLIGKFYDSFQELSKQPASSTARTVVAQQTQALTDALNHTANKLEELKTNSQELLKTNVTDVNSLLNQIDNVNKEIMSVVTVGQNPNDLLDTRDVLLDDLSNKFGITIDKGNFQGISVKPTDAGNMKVTNFVSASPNTDVARLSYISSIIKDPNDPNAHIITYYKLGDMKSDETMQTLKITGLTDKQAKEIDTSRVLWANGEGQATRADGHPIRNGDVITAAELMIFSPSAGEIAGNISVQQDVQEYMDQLDKVAMALAFSVNAIHSGLEGTYNLGGEPAMDYLPFFVNKDVAFYRNGELANLDATLIAESGINAKNININQEIINDVMKIKTKTNDCDFAYTSENNINGEGDGARALAIASLRDTLMKIQDFGSTIKTREDLFASNKGGSSLSNYGMTITNNNNGMKIDSYYQDVIDRLGIQAQEANRVVTNQENMLSELENTKASVSGVSLDEELAGMIQFQHSYNASAKIISTVDELLDVVINGLKR